jgi:hypothetical protein
MTVCCSRSRPDSPSHGNGCLLLLLLLLVLLLLLCSLSAAAAGADVSSLSHSALILPSSTQPAHANAMRMQRLDSNTSLLDYQNWP